MYFQRLFFVGLQIICTTFFLTMDSNFDDAIFELPYIDLDNRISISTQFNDLKNRPPVLRGQKFGGCVLELLDDVKSYRHPRPSPAKNESN